jgi:mono/diheme cytochrome c family protein
VTHSVFLLLFLLAACGGQPREQAGGRPLGLPAGVEPVHISMADLHASGGTPPGWHFTLPAGDVEQGRRTFVDLGCPSCHVVRGEPFSPPPGAPAVGPELTGMGSHHPPLYFAESIINPDAVVVDGPGYASDDGHSRMPTYPDLTVVQLADLVAYLRSLTDPSEAHASAAPAGAGVRPAPPAGAATIFLVQMYDVKDGQLAAFEEWFGREGSAALRAVPGLVTVDTWVDNTRPGPALLTMFGFRDDMALSRFLHDPAGSALKQHFDDFVGPHGHQLFRTPPIYRVGELSTP